MLWLYLHFPHLLLDSQATSSTEKPAVIVNTHSNRVVQCNEAAIRQGITLDMRMASAALMVNDLVIHPYDESNEIKQLEQLADWLYLVTSDICLHKPQGLLLRVTPMLTLCGGLSAYWQQVQQHLSSKNLRYHYASAHTGIAAKLLALQAVNCITDRSSEIQKALHKTPVHLLELPQQHTEALIRCGIQSLNQLIQQPLAALAKRFDIQLITYLGRLTGELKHVHTFHLPKQRFERHLILLFDIENLSLVSKPLLTLLNELEKHLKAACEVAYQLSLTLHLRDAEPECITIDALQGETQSNQWLTLCEFKLSHITLVQPISELTLRVTRTGSHDSRVSTDLFNKQNDQTSALALISVLAAKIGEGDVNHLSVYPDYRPENSNQRHRQFTPYPKTPFTADQRPSLLLQHPTPLQGDITIKQGPERIITGWWDGHSVYRDYFIAKDKDGAWLWIFRDKQQQWFIHGWFS